MIGWSAPVDFAVEKLQGGSENALEIELAGVSKSEAFLVGELLEKLAKNASDYEETLAKRKWLFLQLSWVYKNREKFSDPFDEVDKLYSDFDYPPAMEHLVSFMPVSEPDQRTDELYRLEQWRDFLESEKSFFIESNEQPRLFSWVES